MAHDTPKAAQSGILTDEEIHAMAQVLARRYHARAMDVALHFAFEHEAIGDLARAGLWTRVAEFLPQGNEARGNEAPTLS